MRIYRPVGDAPAPTVVFFHGGGWVLGDLDMHDATCRKIANRLGAVVVNVDYRLAPEDPFPAALDDAAAAVEWAAASIDDLGGDPSRLILAGASAGGNLVAALAQMARTETPAVPIALQVLIYPVIDSRMETASHREFARGYLLEHEQMRWYLQQYVPDATLHTDPRVSPGHAASLAGLPPAVIVTAEFDPLRDEAESYADRLRAAGVPVSLTRYPGQIHGFMNMFGVIADAEEAITALVGETDSLLSAGRTEEGTRVR